MTDNLEALYKFHFDCRRLGELSGLFIAPKWKVQKLISSGDTIYFGEVLGKHSDISGPLEMADLTILTDKPEEIEFVRRLEIENGFNPIRTYEERNGEIE